MRALKSDCLLKLSPRADSFAPTAFAGSGNTGRVQRPEAMIEMSKHCASIGERLLPETVQRLNSFLPPTALLWFGEQHGEACLAARPDTPSTLVAEAADTWKLS